MQNDDRLLEIAIKYDIAKKNNNIKLMKYYKDMYEKLKLNITST